MPSGSKINWPDPNEYDWALQNRDKTFYDPDIQRGNLTMLASGQARLNGGGSRYVCVYHVGNWVVRCFAAQPPKITPPSEISLRYRTITAYLNRPHYISDFAFLAKPTWVERGLNVKGDDLPFVKVPFISNGQSLGDFLCANYSDPAAMHKLAQLWFEITQRLDLRQVAHGDLDMSNVLVCGTLPAISLKLIDFDGMYVPDLAKYRLDVADSGHMHFQPAKKGVRKFGPELDRFSVLTIYITLIALAKNPALWENCDADETRSLLGAEDFERLGFSQNFTRLNQERNNSDLQECLQELQNSIIQNRMPRSLSEILHKTGMRSDRYFHGDEPTPLPAYTGRPPVIPLEQDEEPETKLDTAPPPPPPSPSPSPKPVYTPPPTSPYTGSSLPLPQKQGRRKGWLIAAVIIAIIIGLIIWWLVARNQQPQSFSPFIAQALLFLPPRRERFSAKTQFQEGGYNG